MTLKQATRKNEKTGFTGTRLLCLIRHGEAAPKDVGLDDFERSLTPKGIKECEKVAKVLYKTNCTFDLFISSPADRAVETAHLFATELNYPIQQIQIVNALYSAHSPSGVLPILRKTDDSIRSVALFGHNPLFSDLAAYFLENFEQSMVKGSAVGIALHDTAWHKLDRNAGLFAFYATPNDKHTHLKAVQ